MEGTAEEDQRAVSSGVGWELDREEGPKITSQRHRDVNGSG